MPEKELKKLLDKPPGLTYLPRAVSKLNPNPLCNTLSVRLEREIEICCAGV